MGGRTRVNLQVVVIIVFYRTKTRDVVIVIVYGGWIYKYLCNQSVSIATNVVSSNPVHGEFYSIQYYAMKFIRDLQPPCDHDHDGPLFLFCKTQ
jgi:hypothetical protein